MPSFKEMNFLEKRNYEIKEKEKYLTEVKEKIQELLDNIFTSDFDIKFQNWTTNTNENFLINFVFSYIIRYENFECIAYFVSYNKEIKEININGINLPVLRYYLQKEKDEIYSSFIKEKSNSDIINDIFN